MDDIYSEVFAPAKERVTTEVARNLGIDEMPLAMAYVPMQKWEDIYDIDVGFERATIFAKLDLPFLGRKAIDE